MCATVFFSFTLIGGGGKKKLIRQNLLAAKPQQTVNPVYYCFFFLLLLLAATVHERCVAVVGGESKMEHVELWFWLTGYPHFWDKEQTSCVSCFAATPPKVSRRVGVEKITASVYLSSAPATWTHCYLHIHQRFTGLMCKYAANTSFLYSSRCFRHLRFYWRTNHWLIFIFKQAK